MRLMPGTAFKNCPFCAEQIREEAIKCRFCGEWLVERPPQNTEKTKRKPEPEPRREIPQPKPIPAPTPIAAQKPLPAPTKSATPPIATAPAPEQAPPNPVLYTLKPWVFPTKPNSLGASPLWPLLFLAAWLFGYILPVILAAGPTDMPALLAVALRCSITPVSLLVFLTFGIWYWAARRTRPLGVAIGELFKPAIWPAFWITLTCGVVVAFSYTRIHWALMLQTPVQARELAGTGSALPQVTPTNSVATPSAATPQPPTEADIP
jgi:hypothetical protein